MSWIFPANLASDLRKWPSWFITGHRWSRSCAPYVPRMCPRELAPRRQSASLCSRFRKPLLDSLGTQSDCAVTPALVLAERPATLSARSQRRFGHQRVIRRDDGAKVLCPPRVPSPRAGQAWPTSKCSGGESAPPQCSTEAVEQTARRSGLNRLPSFKEVVDAGVALRGPPRPTSVSSVPTHLVTTKLPHVMATARER